MKKRAASFSQGRDNTRRQRFVLGPGHWRVPLLDYFAWCVIQAEALRNFAERHL